ncbi:MAG: GTP cyclohydrolase FolE2 [Syntrophobacteraceae bacterium]|jgi:GTP cyclohydrolase I|nr:GTP cyclohydrolase FolE2 [Syntrophobacteraceae bacterium]
MIDVQSQADYRNIGIDKVGVKDIRYPVTVMDKNNGVQNTVASINMYVNVPREFKGTHMSRFIEILNEFHGHLDIREFSSVLKALQEHLRAESAHMEINFPYFIRKLSPVTGSPGLMEYGCRITGSLDMEKGYDLVVEVNVPITTVCPCSKEMSDYGAHNQRGSVRLAVRFKHFIWIEDLIDLVERSASCDVFSVLKRPDEKYVTEFAYENPKFVEDVVRDIAFELKRDANVCWFLVDVENFESIHNHSAYAFIERWK